MIRNTFCHIPGVGEKIEQKLWKSGIREWNDLESPVSEKISSAVLSRLKLFIQESESHLEQRDAVYFQNFLSSHLHWRYFPEFQKDVVYLDIETNGLAAEYGEITTISTYDGRTVNWYVNGQNLKHFIHDIKQYRVIITYNGRSFDVPFIERHFGVRLPHAQIDLRYVLKSLGYRGGLKKCETELGIDRGELNGVDGYFAVLLWNDYKKHRNTRALETLLAYNIEDVVNLEPLMIMAFNMKINQTPFASTGSLPDPPKKPDIPFGADRKTIERLKYASLAPPKELEAYSRSDFSGDIWNP